MKVQLMIFSGRPDPEFQVPDDALSDFASRVGQAVQGTMSEPPPEGGLGYRGFHVFNDEALEGFPAEVEVFRGVVTEFVGGDTRHFVDAAGVEGFLLEQARAAGLGEILDAAGAGELFA